MNRTAVLVVLLGVVATAAGLLFYYGCDAGLGVGCPGSTFRPVGLVAQAVGEAVLVIGVAFVPRMMPSAAVEEPGAEAADDEPEEPRPARPARPARAAPVARAATAKPAGMASNPRAKLFFCPECGRHYRTVTGKYCPVDAAELRPMTE